MWQLNGPAANYLFACIVFLLTFTLIFSFRDTLRGLREFFDFRAIRRLLRSRWAGFLLAGAAMGLAALYWTINDLRDFGLLLAIAGLFLVPVASLAWIVLSDVRELYGRRGRRGRPAFKSGSREGPG